MLQIDGLEALQHWISDWHSDSETVAWVPTMGNLHAGHLQLVDVARSTANRVVVSLFVNPTQFGEGEDYQNYPRTLEADLAQLQAAGVDLVYLPSVSDMYASGIGTVIDIPELSNSLCGVYRPGHFQGVATVVCKLLNRIQPDSAVFGEKDFQQLAVIRRMVEDLDIQVRIHAVATVREADGLALSSRNVYLSAQERSTAPGLYQALQRAAECIRLGERDYEVLEQRQLAVLQKAGFRPDYFSTRQAADLRSASPDSTDLVILAAAWLGRARLIDNVQLRVE